MGWPGFGGGGANLFAILSACDDVSISPLQPPLPLVGSSPRAYDALHSGTWWRRATRGTCCTASSGTPTWRPPLRRRAARVSCSSSLLLATPVDLARTECRGGGRGSHGAARDQAAWMFVHTISGTAASTFSTRRPTARRSLRAVTNAHWWTRSQCWVRRLATWRPSPGLTMRGVMDGINLRDQTTPMMEEAPWGVTGRALTTSPAAPWGRTAIATTLPPSPPRWSYAYPRWYSEAAWCNSMTNSGTEARQTDEPLTPLERGGDASAVSTRRGPRQRLAVPTDGGAATVTNRQTEGPQCDALPGKPGG